MESIHERINQRFEESHTRAVKRKPGLAMRGSGEGFHSNTARKERAFTHFLNSFFVPSFIEPTREPLPEMLPREGIIFCQAASRQFVAATAEADGDPRIAMGRWALKQAGQHNGGWIPTWDSREAFSRNALRKGEQYA